MKAGKQQDFATMVKAELLFHPTLTTVSDLARELGYHRNTVSRAIHHGSFRRVRKEIARKLHISLQ